MGIAGKIDIIILSALPVVTEGLKNLLSGENHLNIIDYFEGYIDGLELLSNRRIDIVILDDTSLGQAEFYDLLNKVLRNKFNPKIIIFTFNTDADFFKVIINGGIRGLLHKKVGKEKILEAITVVSANGVYIDERISNLILRHNIKETLYKDITEKLSRREKDVLTLILQGFENKAIAKKLFISTKTVETHKEKIKDKTGISSVKELYKLNLSHLDN